jgi:phage shock protein PspC (stress-responsive transcriptional regulator)
MHHTPRIHFAQDLRPRARLAPRWMDGCLQRPCHRTPLPGSVEWIKLASVSGVTFPASAFPPPPAATPPAPPLPDQYSGIYRSSDEKVLVGFCGGLSHRLNVAPGLVRFLLVLTWFFTWSATFWIYWFALLLPELPTRQLRQR